MLKVLYFAGCRELTGTSEEELELEGLSLDAAQKFIFEKYPQLSEKQNYLKWALNHEFIEEKALILQQNDELAIIPPVAGG